MKPKPKTEDPERVKILGLANPQTTIQTNREENQQENVGTPVASSQEQEASLSGLSSREVTEGHIEKNVVLQFPTLSRLITYENIDQSPISQATEGMVQEQEGKHPHQQLKESESSHFHCYTYAR